MWEVSKWQFYARAIITRGGGNTISAERVNITLLLIYPLYRKACASCKENGYKLLPHFGNGLSCLIVSNKVSCQNENLSISLISAKNHLLVLLTVSFFYIAFISALIIYYIVLNHLLSPSFYLICLLWFYFPSFLR